MAPEYKQTCPECKRPAYFGFGPKDIYCSNPNCPYYEKPKDNKDIDYGPAERNTEEAVTTKKIQNPWFSSDPFDDLW